MRKKMLITAIILILALSLGTMVACGDNKMEKATISSVWPDNEFTKAIPEMTVGKLFSYTEFVKHDRIMFVVTDITEEDFNSYRQAVLDFGYRQTKEEVDDQSISVEYKNDNYRVTIFFGGASVTLRVYKK